MKYKAWLVTIIVFLAGVLFAAGNFKVPPTMVAVLGEMKVSIIMGGWLMSSSALAGIVLALPAGGIMSKIGPKKLGLFALFCALIGNIVGALAANFMMLMVGRLIEGIGFGLIGVVAPAIIALCFPAEKRGLPMAIWSVWVGTGMLLIFSATNVIMPLFSWRGVWWFVAILAAIMLVLFAGGVQVPVQVAKAESVVLKQETAALKPDLPYEGFKSPASWLLSLIFLMFGFGVGAMLTFAPTFMVEEVGMDVVNANMNTSVMTFGMISGGILMGFVLNKVKNRSLLLIVSMALSAIFMGLTFEVTSPNLILPFMLIMGLTYSMVPAVIFTISPEAAVSPATVGITMGIIVLGQNLSGFIGPVFIGAIVERGGGAWSAATLPFVVAGIIGVIASVLYGLVMKQRASDQSSQLSGLLNKKTGAA
ncbi:MFS transporter [Desulfosporosinus sp. HMP52]|uniref:MFS transporter n=1 Tax=Desulfosporosinus sp. HMP52 TaxID=1487923 RepID=UPI00068D21E4|nr:MFS transporter [Desulfosporosinus sp. HMP52]